MPLQTRSDYKTGVSSVIYTNKFKAVKGNTVRDKLNLLADCVFFKDEVNAPGGVMLIDALSGSVDASFIKSSSPSGKYLKDDGTWETVSASLPNQTGQSGKFLTTNGTVASWGTISTSSSWGSITGTIASQTDLTSYIATQVANLVASAPSALDTLNELAAALGNDANFATTVTTALAGKAPIASPSFTGTITTPLTGGGNKFLLANNSGQLIGTGVTYTNGSGSNYYIDVDTFMQIGYQPSYGNTFWLSLVHI